MLTLSFQTADPSIWSVVEQDLSEPETQKVKTTWGRSYITPQPIDQVLQWALDWVQHYPLSILIDSPPLLIPDPAEAATYPALAIAEQALTTTIAHSLTLVITHHVFWQLPHGGHYHLRLIAQLATPPPLERISLFEIFNTEPLAIRAKKQETKTQFEQGLFLFFLGFYAEAQYLFDDCLTLNPADTVAAHYIQCCRQALTLQTKVPLPPQQNP